MCATSRLVNSLPFYICCTSSKYSPLKNDPNYNCNIFFARRSRSDLESLPFTFASTIEYKHNFTTRLVHSLCVRDPAYKELFINIKYRLKSMLTIKSVSQIYNRFVHNEGQRRGDIQQLASKVHFERLSSMHTFLIYE